MKGKAPDDWRTAIYYHYFEYPSVHMVAKHYGIRTQRYKLMRFYQFDEWEFYDLNEDPDERQNLYSDPAHAETIAKLKEELAALQEHYKDESDVRVMPPEWRTQFR